MTALAVAVAVLAGRDGRHERQQSGQDTLDAVSFLCAKVARQQRMNGLSAIGDSDASGDGDPCAVIIDNQ